MDELSIGVHVVGGEVGAEVGGLCDTRGVERTVLANVDDWARLGVTLTKEEEVKRILFSEDYEVALQEPWALAVGWSGVGGRTAQRPERDCRGYEIGDEDWSFEVGKVGGGGGGGSGSSSGGGRGGGRKGSRGGCGFGTFRVIVVGGGRGVVVVEVVVNIAQ